MTIYENNKQLLTTMGGNADNYSTDFEVRKAILDALGGNSSICSNIYEVDLQILKIFQEGGGAGGGDCDLIPITITENGVYSRESGGYSEVVVNVESEVKRTKVSSLTVNNDCIVDGTWDGDGIDTSNVTNTSSMFKNCSSLQSLDVSNWNTSNVTNMNSMFKNCSSLQSVGDLSNWDTSKVTNMYGVFSGCSSLQTLDVSNWDTSNVTSMSDMFSNCSSLQSLDLSDWDTSNVTNMGLMFYNCDLLQSLDLSNWDTSKVTAMSSMLNYCIKLTTLIGGRTIDEVLSNNISTFNGLKINISLDSTILDRASLRAIINGLADLTGSSAQTITLGSTLITKLTEEDIAVATAKNWTIA